MDRADHTGPVYLLSKSEIEYGIHISPLRVITLRE